MYYVVAFLFIIAVYTAYSGARANDKGSVKFGAILLVVALGSTMITLFALSALHT